MKALEKLNIDLTMQILSIQYFVNTPITKIVKSLTQFNEYSFKQLSKVLNFVKLKDYATIISIHTCLFIPWRISDPYL